MDYTGGHRPPDKRQRRRCVILSVIFVLVIMITLAVTLTLTLRHNTDQLKPIFIDRCKKFSRNDCEKIWDVFKQAYVGKDPCEVPMEAYDPLIAAAPFKPHCNRMMFWSKTKNLVHKFTEKRDCFLTLEDMLLGSVLDGLTWCGKEGSSETFTTGCPGWSECENNPVRSFWNRASAALADVACGDVTAMLNGSITTPFSPTSVFASIEVKRFNATKMKRLNVVLVTQTNAVTNCTNASLKDLRKELDKGIKYNCTEVTEFQIEECSNHPEKPCGSCW
ncbi:ADP-ribosyl cyclase/cyclic ADP-ribose hydrolase 1-like [Seriola lalandi dorsalis]|uniref:ADP-ribosyl cyclase/cyclic ADP-ribose hydrolase n=1 Tax=Seriola lalandi dorsalis TaxID=1841481 RepID=A0A3B4YUB8_SERLL|nr:ADP-ribosyl cyclase/cyclic ADP-ribose hydrolase 1-like [Seriola lalandi dorsalis]XP_056219684.1 ADP-ribosyl cyclase/cyclic ADP-ribose hydrolase 1-like [Seriola aureovittata]